MLGKQERNLGDVLWYSASQWGLHLKDCLEGIFPRQWH